MLIIRKNEINNLITTVSMNKTLPNPYYLFSFQHIASKERISFIPEVITTNCRYDKFRFLEGGNVNLSITPPEVYFEYLGQYYYSMYEQLSPTNTNIALAYNKLESGRAIVIVGNDEQTCFFEPYISNDEDFAQVIYVSEQEQLCISGNTTPTPTPSFTPTMTPSMTPTSTTTPTTTPTMTPTPSTTPPPFDADANAYLTAVISAGGTGITPTVSAATTNMFVSLKSNNLYNKLYTLYPALGGTAGSCKFNAINPLDTDAAFRLTFFGGGTFSQATGYLGNQINAFADTHFNPLTQGVPYTSFTMFDYVTVDGNHGYDIGAAASSIFVGMASRRNAHFQGQIVTSSAGFNLSASTTALGTHILSRNNSTSSVSIVQNGGNVNSIPQSTTSLSMPNFDLLINVYGGVGLFSDKGLSTFGFAQGLTNIEIANLRNIITTFNNAIGR